MNARGIRTNFMFNVAGALAPLIIALVTVPIYVSHIGAARYGALSIVWVLLGYFGFLDLGMSRASANALAKHEEARERSSILVTAFAINLALGVAGGLVLYIGGRAFLQYLLDVPPELEGELDSVFPWLACVVPMTLLTGVASGALESRERFLTINALHVAGSVVGQAFPVLCAALVSPSLSVVVPAAVLVRFPLFLLMLAFVIRREGPLSARRVPWAAIVEDVIDSRRPSEEPMSKTLLHGNRAIELVGVLLLTRDRAGVWNDRRRQAKARAERAILTRVGPGHLHGQIRERFP